MSNGGISGREEREYKKTGTKDRAPSGQFPWDFWTSCFLLKGELNVPRASVADPSV